MGITDSLHQRRLVLELRYLFQREYQGEPCKAEALAESLRSEMRLKSDFLEGVSMHRVQPSDVTVRPTRPQSAVHNPNLKSSPYTTLAGPASRIPRQRPRSATPAYHRPYLSHEEAMAATASLTGELPAAEIQAALLDAFPFAMKGLASPEPQAASSRPLSATLRPATAPPTPRPTAAKSTFARRPVKYQAYTPYATYARSATDAEQEDEVGRLRSALEATSSSLTTAIGQREALQRELQNLRSRNQEMESQLQNMNRDRTNSQQELQESKRANEAFPLRANRTDNVTAKLAKSYVTN
jgi:hypothetical protein